MLAEAGARVLVLAMGSGAWEDTRELFAGFLQRGGGGAADAVALLDQSRADLLEAAGAESGRVRQEHEALWLHRLEEVAGRDPGAAGALRVLISTVSALLGDGEGGVSQSVAASGQAQVAVLGSGTQNVYFQTPPSAEVVPAVLRLADWVVDRPSEVDRVVAALLQDETVAATTAVHGAGGFGKTTVARMVQADPRVLAEFGNRVYWVTVGRDAGPNVLAGLVNGLIAWIRPDKAGTFTDARQAADYLAALLAGGLRRLIIVDDVWSEEQLAVFPVAGQCARLVTTRFPGLGGDGEVTRVRVDEMSQPEAQALLLAGIPLLSSALSGALMKETGRWPLLLRLVNKILIDQGRFGSDISDVARDLLGRLRAGGTLQPDELTGTVVRQLDVSDPVQRGKAVRATIEASTGLLSQAEHDRLAELAVFAEDETIPVSLIALLWRATCGADALAARTLSARLSDLALLIPGPGGTVTMHDVIRDYFCAELGGTRLTQLHEALLHAAAENLPAAAVVAGPGMVTAWWELPGDTPYLQEHLIEHMLAAGRASEAETLVTDLRWVVARLDRSGIAGPYSDLALLRTPRAERLSRVLGAAAHLLAPTDPPYSRADILCSRVGRDSDWGPQAGAFQKARRFPALINQWPLPDLPGPGLRRTIAAHAGSAVAVAIASDDAWLASVGGDEKVRIWDAVTGRQSAVGDAHAAWVSAVAIAPDGTWLATTDFGAVQIWEVAADRQRTILTGDLDDMYAMAIAPDGTWLATAGKKGIVQVLDAATGRKRAAMSNNDHKVYAVAIAPDGTWLATGGDDGVRIWDPLTGERRAVLARKQGTVEAVAIAPDGTWLASADDGPVRLWDTATGRQRMVLTGHDGWVKAVAIAPDGAWLASAGIDGSVRLWDTATGRQRMVFTGHDGWVKAVAIARDGTWLASAGDDGTVRFWDAAAVPGSTTEPHASPKKPLVTLGPDGTWMATGPAIGSGDIPKISTVAFAPDGTWLATGSDDQTVRIWDAFTGRQRIAVYANDRKVRAVAVAADGTWLASVGYDETVGIWETATGRQRTVLSGYDSWGEAVAVAPDGTWLAAGGDDRTVRIWDAATGVLRLELSGQDVVYAVAIAPDGTWLAAGSGDGAVRIWDTSTGMLRTVLSGHEGRVDSVAVAPDGTWLASAGADGMVRVWEPDTGRQRVVLSGHDESVRAVAVAPGGAWLASVGDDRSVRIWDAATGDARALMRTERSLRSCAWGPDDTSLAVAGDAYLCVFSFAPPELATGKDAHPAPG